MAATTRRRTPAAKPAGDPAPQRPDFEVVGDELVCHTYDDMRLSLVIPMARYQRFLDINADATMWPDQIAAWKSEVMPPEVAEAIDREGERDFAASFELAHQWARGLDVRLGKALS